ncbi:hypothetical protein NRS6110_03022 [Bacillus subtilis]|nr:uncharacterized protein SRCM101280_03815 [Bacillus subtilis]CAF1769813.1 hypothetical protein NRS6110_03022 [Bacillus subtilis]CAF1776907.1 hypothetical protein NRS6108_03470 [Bacillus subtilis]SEN95778.1 Protein of unknown function [Bacillus subtilis]
MILVSSCLGGIECRYNGSHAASEKIRKLVDERKQSWLALNFSAASLPHANPQKS